MARVIYLPGGGLRLEFEQPLEAEALARQVESGAWQPPAGCPAPAGPLRAHVCGGWLVVTAEPGYLAKWTASSQVVSYQRRFLAAAQGQR